MLTGIGSVEKLMLKLLLGMAQISDPEVFGQNRPLMRWQAWGC